MDRRTFNTALAGAVATSLFGCATAPRSDGGSRSALYQSVGARLRRFDVDVEGARLTPRETLELPSNVQYAWPHPSRQFLYVSTSDSASGNTAVPGRLHRLCALRIDAGGALQMHGEPQALHSRPIHTSVDATGAYALNAYNNPSSISVHRINHDGTLGTAVQQTSKLDTGIFAHQVRTTPSNRSVYFVTRGNRPESNKAEDPGALKIYNFKDGMLSPAANITPGGKGGHGYGPRHLDFHPTQPWVYVSVESQNQLHMHRMRGDEISAEPAYIKSVTAGNYDISFPQAAGAIHVHPNGRTVYISNRANATVDFNGKRVFRGGENNIAVFSIDQNTGEPTLIQHADPRSYHVRTFTIDPSGRLMVAASIDGIAVREGDNVRDVPAALSVFRIGADGKLEFVRKYDVELGGKFQWWAGIVELPASGRG
jgi:6-phosphogluconolactonase (cycloisomerase 2 family)